MHNRPNAPAPKTIKDFNLYLKGLLQAAIKIIRTHSKYQSTSSFRSCAIRLANEKFYLAPEELAYFQLLADWSLAVKDNMRSTLVNKFLPQIASRQETLMTLHIHEKSYVVVKKIQKKIFDSALRKKPEVIYPNLSYSKISFDNTDGYIYTADRVILDAINIAVAANLGNSARWTQLLHKIRAYQLNTMIQALTSLITAPKVKKRSWLNWMQTPEQNPTVNNNDVAGIEKIITQLQFLLKQVQNSPDKTTYALAPITLLVGSDSFEVINKLLLGSYVSRACRYIEEVKEIGYSPQFSKKK